MMRYLAQLDRRARAMIVLILAVVLFFAVNIFSNVAFKSVQVDLTQDKLFTLSGGTLKVLAALDEPIDVRLFFTRALGERSPQSGRYFNRVRELLLQYAAASDGRLRVTFETPEPFSTTEDRAVAYGLEAVPVNEAGDQGFFGLAATNSTDDQAIVPFFNTERETFLEYDLTKLIHRLANPEKKIVGLLSTLPIDGNALLGQPQTERWPLVGRILDFFQVLPLPTDVRKIPDEIDVLLTVHPVGLNRFTRYAIDQFVIRGGRALIFVDPVAEVEAAISQKRGFRPRGSNFNTVLAAWGLRLASGQVIGDIDAARRVNVRDGTQMRVADYVAWLGLDEKNFDQNDVVTGDISLLNIASAGILEMVPGSGAAVTPLITSGARSMRIAADKIANGADVIGLFKAFAPGEKKLMIAARASGLTRSAFRDGAPRERDGSPASTTGQPHVSVAKNPVSVIVVADVDMLHQRFWLDINDTMGQRVLVPNANNADFVVNALDNLSGSDALIALRGRGESTRPFDLVLDIRRQAERRFRDKEQELREKLTSAQNRLNQQLSGGRSRAGAVLRAGEKQALDDSQVEMFAIRNELRDVQHELRKDIERLEAWAKFLNIAAIPILLAFATLCFTIVTRLRRRARMRAIKARAAA